MRFLLTVFFLAVASSLFAAAPDGVPRELARERARRLSDLGYHIQFILTPHSDFAKGHEEIRFQLKSASATIAVGEPLLLDFREGIASGLSINGSATPTMADHGHILLSADKLRAGENTVALDFTAPVATAGKAIIRYEDRDDNSEYLYTLFVPMDASMAFPCFDQPDLKGSFRLEITAPADWTIISNSPIANTLPGHTAFAETQPISTYLFAFAAGHFRKIEKPGFPSLYVRQSKMGRAQEEASEVQQTAARGIQHLTQFFAQPFPFPKYDMVLIPGMAYGGMEHAGATFLREESVLFRTAPTHSDHLSRDTLVLHELSHQWFGDLTTMRWFDDLWLKEGFAQYMAYETEAQLKPSEHIWKRFYQAIKPAAYAIDSTKGTTPIYQDIGNLKDAKSAYGAIVYSKAPGLLKQLSFVLGAEHFRDGLRLYLKEHAYGNAEWSDLVRAFERVSGESLTDWARAWIQRRGMPQVDVDWSCDGQNRVSHLSLSQRDVLDEGGVWPITTQLLLATAPNDASIIHLRAQLTAPRADVREAVGKPCPHFIFANDQDYAYGRFLLDPHSRHAVMEKLGRISDPFERTLLWGALWESVRQAELPPREFLEAAVRLLPAETDESLAQNLIAHVTTALHRYVNAEGRLQIVPKMESVASDLMLHSPDQGLRIIWFRALRSIAETPQGRQSLKDLLSGKLSVPGVELRPLDRWNMIASLIALDDPQAGVLLAAEQKRDNTGDGKKYAYMAEAARPDASMKQQYFHDYLHDPLRPEDWIEQSLGTFNYWNQPQLTAPYLQSALDALPQVKRERKIFFMLSWLSAFIGGQQSSAAQAQVNTFVQSENLDKDLKLKVLEVKDELDRTVRIRQKYP